MNTAVLMEHGIDYEKGLARFAGDQEIYEMVLLNFAEDDHCLIEARTAFSEKDYEMLFNAVHEIKGASGNCDMTELFAISSELCEYVREDNFKVNEENIERAYPIFEKAYIKVIEGIKKAAQ